MAEYLKRETAIGFVKNRTPHMDGWTTLNAVEVSLQNDPAADVVEVRHGEWVQIGYDEAMDRITCSCCKEYWNINDNDTETFNYCPNCGAKMDGKGEGECREY
jgi:predicted RNA-binding Zn-ribbon protein involved in translation (DUF1610 family)